MLRRADAERRGPDTDRSGPFVPVAAWVPTDKDNPLARGGTTCMSEGWDGTGHPPAT
ncbi:hypothetical protein GCM10023237_60930 [Streptomyces coeruleoprunus]